MDKVMISQMEFYGYHGLFPEENKLGQRFLVDVDLFTDVKKAGKSDDMNDSIDYGYVYTLVQNVLEGEAKKLVEAVAEKVADDLLTTFANLSACTVKVIKPDPPISGHYKSVAVEIYREKTA